MDALEAFWHETSGHFATTETDHLLWSQVAGVSDLHLDDGWGLLHF